MHFSCERIRCHNSEPGPVHYDPNKLIFFLILSSHWIWSNMILFATWPVTFMLMLQMLVF